MKKRLTLILTLAICILLSACALDDATLEKIQAGADRMHYAKSYKTSILVTFNSENDIEAFEKRLDVLDLTVEEKEEQDGKIKYKLKSHYSPQKYGFGALSTAKTQSIDIVDSDGNVVLTEGVSVFEFRGDMVVLEVPDEIFENYEYHDIINFDFRLDETVFDTYFGTRNMDGKEYIVFQRTAKSYDYEKMVKAALAFSGIRLENDVKIEVVD